MSDFEGWKKKGARPSKWERDRQRKQEMLAVQAEARKLEGVEFGPCENDIVSHADDYDKRRVEPCGQPATYVGFLHHKKLNVCDGCRPQFVHTEPRFARGGTPVEGYEDTVVQVRHLKEDDPATRTKEQWLAMGYDDVPEGWFR